MLEMVDALVSDTSSARQGVLSYLLETIFSSFCTRDLLVWSHATRRTCPSGHLGLEFWALHLLFATGYTWPTQHKPASAPARPSHATNITQVCVLCFARLLSEFVRQLPP